MKRRMLAILTAVVLIIGAIVLYHHFVTDRITDKGGMENPDAATEISQFDKEN